jgi:hypothetical protein
MSKNSFGLCRMAPSRVRRGRSVRTVLAEFDVRLPRTTLLVPAPTSAEAQALEFS